jgi:hypothetical protein
MNPNAKSSTENAFYSALRFAHFQPLRIGDSVINMNRVIGIGPADNVVYNEKTSLHHGLAQYRHGQTIPGKTFVVAVDTPDDRRFLLCSEGTTACADVERAWKKALDIVDAGAKADFDV